MRSRCLALAVVCLAAVPLFAQAPAVTLAFAALTRSIDSQKAEAGQPVPLKLLRNITAGGNVLIARGTPLSAHVAKVESVGKHTILSLVLDQALPANGKPIPLQGIIVALAKVEDRSLASDPQASMLRSLEPTTESTTERNASSGAAVATAQLGREGAGPALSLEPTSQGALGYDNVTLSWELKQPPPATILSAKSKRLVLTSGTQVLIRMATPRPPE